MGAAIQLTGMGAHEKGAAAWRSFLVVRAPDARTITVGELGAQLVDRWGAEGRSSVRDLRSALKHHIDPAFGPMPCAELRPEYVVAWIQALLSDGKAPKTVRKLVSFLSSVLALAVEAGAVETNPVQLLPRGALPINRPRDPTRTALEILDLDQVAQVLRAQDTLNAPHWVFWSLLLLTGARFGEIAALRWRDISGGVLRLERSWNWKDRVETPTKTGIARHVPVSRHLAPVLEVGAELTRKAKRREVTADDLVAPYIEKYWYRHWNDRTANRRWREDQERLGFVAPPTGRPSLKATRHTFTTLARRAGGDAAAVHMITHASAPDSRTSARVYTHFDFRDAETVIRLLDAALDEAMETAP